MKKKWKKLYNSSVSFTCPYCLQQFLLTEATRDHKNPKSRFHDNSPENIVLCCKECNHEKGALTAEEYEIWKRLNDIRVHGIKKER